MSTQNYFKYPDLCPLNMIFSNLVLHIIFTIELLGMICFSILKKNYYFLKLFNQKLADQIEIHAF